MAMLEMLFEQELPDDVKAYLLGLFGADGVRETVLEGEYQGCESCKAQDACERCWYTAPVEEGTLAECVCEVIYSLNHGILELPEGPFTASCPEPGLRCADTGEHGRSATLGSSPGSNPASACF